MLLNFAITNFRSIKTRQVFSMMPSPKVKNRFVSLNIASKYGERIGGVRAAVLYGPNNAGKSNTLTAFKALALLVENSHKLNIGEKIKANEAFAFDLEWNQEPTTFEVDFVAKNGTRYVYQVAFTKEKIITETLDYYNISETGKMTLNKVFHRKNEKEDVSFGDFKGEKKRLAKELNPNQLLLSKAANNNYETVAPVYQYFSSHLSVMMLDESGRDFREIASNALAKFLIENKESFIFDTINEVIASFDTGILRFEVTENEETNFRFPASISDEEQKKIIEQFKYKIQTVHKLFQGNKEIGTTNLNLSEESLGTNKLFVLLSIVLTALKDGDTLIIDELDKSLHRNITLNIIQLFHNPTSNPNGAQLIFSTHDVSLLIDDVLNRDQMWLIEKDECGASDLYSVAEIEGLRPDIPLEKWYMTGRLGATPNISNRTIYNIISHNLEHQASHA